MLTKTNNKMEKLITISFDDLRIKGITKGSNALVASKYGEFLISKRNFNLLAKQNAKPMTGAIVSVDGYSCLMFKTLSF